MKKEYTIKVWETEEDREDGMPVYEDHQSESVDEVVEKAIKSYRNGACAVEVEDEDGRLVYHISDDEDSCEPYVDDCREDFR